MKNAVIVQAKRTPIGRVGGSLKEVPPEQLAAHVINSLITEASLDPKEIDDVILGNTIGPGGNLARLALLTAGLPFHVPGITVDRQCASGLAAIHLAIRMVQAGDGEVYLAGGVESSSLAPWKMQKPTTLYAHQGPQVYMRARFSPESIGDPDPGTAAETLVARFGITREEQDRFAALSHEKAVRSMERGHFQKEIVPVPVPARREGVTLVSVDECPRPDTSFEKLSRLAPVFQEQGTVTAGNSCPVNDGAAVALIMSEEKALALGLTPILRCVDAVTVGVDPNLLGIGPVPAVQKLLHRNGLRVEDLDLVEFNEAFAGQAIACLQELQIPFEKVNVGGGAIALGHPYGASGAILVTRLCAEMQRSKAKLGLATLASAGGLGVATLFAAY